MFCAYIFFLGRVILNLGLPSFLINTVLSLLCCTQKSTNKLWQTLSVAQLTKMNSMKTPKPTSIQYTKSEGLQKYSYLGNERPQISTIAKELSKPKLEN